MGIFNFGRKRATIAKNSLVYVPPNSENSFFKNVTEAMKGMVKTNKVRFPKELGEEHPFDFSYCESLAKKYGVVSAIVDKHIDFMMSGGISVKSEDMKAQTIIEEFMRDYNFDTVMRSWFREAFIKNGFLELGEGDDGGIEGVKVLDGNSVYVVRDEYGKIEGYNQYTKPLKNWREYSSEVIPFKERDIAHLAINRYGDNAYGMGIVWQLVLIVNDLIGSRKEMHTLMKRKANNPFIWILGDRTKDEFPDRSKMEEFGERLQWLTNKHDWVVSDYAKPMTLDFGNIGEKFAFIIDNDLELLYMAAQTPAFLMGKAAIAEGLANKQMEGWMHRINSLREEAEKVIEEKIFKRVLNAQGIDSHVEVEWGVPSDEQKMDKVKILTEVVKNPFLMETLRIKIQERMAELLGIDPDEMMEEEEERKKEEEEEEQPIPPEQRKANPKSNPPGKQPPPEKKSEHVHEAYTKKQLEDFDNMTVREWVGFNYSQYKDSVLSRTKKDLFENLRGRTKMEFSAGLLPTRDIEKLRVTMQEGFENNDTIRDIKNNLNKRIDFKDRYMMKDGSMVLRKGKPILSIAAANRAIAIARTETVRLSNLGARDNYKKQKVEKVRWIAAMSERTCEECMDLNGQVMPIDEAIMPPLHPMCRCTIGAVIE